MVTTTLKHDIEWQAPIPLWSESYRGTGEASASIKMRPAILRFADDSFMDELLRVMKQAPWRIADWVAQPETWREPMQTPESILENSAKRLGKKSLAEFLVQRGLSKEQLLKQRKLEKRSHSPIVKNDAVWQQLPLKLYQPAHKRYYIVSASLIENKYGFPDRVLNTSRREKPSFVVRRLVPPENIDPATVTQTPASWDEYAYLKTDKGGKWKKVSSGYDDNNKGTQYLEYTEEQLPLFPISYSDTCGHNRKTYNGLIPVGKREEWLGASVMSGSSEQADYDASDEVGDIKGSLAYSIFIADVIEPWKSLVRDSFDTYKRINEEVNTFDGLIDLPSDKNNEALNNFVKSARERIQTASWYILLDLQKYIEKYLPDIWSAIDEGSEADRLNNAEQALITILKTTTISSSLRAVITGVHYDSNDVEPSLFDALKAVKSQESNLESVDVPYLLDVDVNGNVIPPDSRWPLFLFPLTDPNYGGVFSVINASSKALIPSVSVKRETELNTILENLNEFANLVSSLLPEEVVRGFTNDFIQSRPVLDQKEGWFVVRCVYERPNCGPVFPALVSEATRPFQIAAFFDPDAPQRPFKINMPADISPAGLRKYSKNVGFVMSDMLCGKIKAIRSIGFVDLVLSVLPWPFHKDLPNINDTGPCTGAGGSFGMICSLSIPIVTLCALILLIIMVSLFNMFFYWLPLLFLCLPIPGLKGK